MQEEIACINTFTDCSMKGDNGHKRKLSVGLVVSLSIGSAAPKEIPVLVRFAGAVIKH